MLKRIQPELLKTSYVFCSGAFVGALLFSLSDKSDDVFWGFLALSIAFSILKPRPDNFEALQKRVAEQMDALRYRGLLPPEAQEISDTDVKRLKDAGEAEFAVVCYQSLHRVARKAAERAVSAL